MSSSSPLDSLSEELACKVFDALKLDIVLIPRRSNDQEIALGSLSNFSDFGSLHISSGIWAFGFDSGLYFFISTPVFLDTTKLLVLASRVRAKRVIVVIGAFESSTARHAVKSGAQARISAGAVHGQLSSATFELSIYIAYATDNIELFEPVMSLIETSIDGLGTRSFPLSEIEDQFLADVCWRYGVQMFEYLGIPYAMVDHERNMIKPGVSEAEFELLEMTGALRNIPSAFRSIKTEIFRQRFGSRFGNIASSLKSRWLGSVIIAGADNIGANHVARIDVHRDGFIGSSPFSSLEKAKGGFWGAHGDPCEFLLVDFANDRKCIFGVTASLDLSCLAKTVEVWNVIKHERPSIGIGVIVTPELGDVPTFKSLVSTVSTEMQVMTVSSSWKDSLHIVRLNDGL